MDRTELARMWAKALAYVGCGKLDQASEWAQMLVDTLRGLGVKIR